MPETAAIIPLGAYRDVEPTPDALLADRARREAWFALCRRPFPTRLRDAPPWHCGSPIVLAMWWQLRAFLWTRGPIADDPHQLAEAARVTLRTWRRHADVVGRFFLRTETGAWFDPDLEAARRRALATEERRALRRLQRHRARPSRQPRTAARIAAQDRRIDDA